MYTKIFELIQTKEDVMQLRDEIALLKASLYQTNTDSFQASLDQDVRRSIADAMNTEISTASISPKKYLDGLETALKDISEIKIQVAFEPTNRAITAIRSWLSKNLSEFVVLDIYYNPGVIGGAAISFKGKYYDGTVAKKLNEKV